MSVNIPEHITTPVITCMTVSIYSFLAMMAMEKAAILLQSMVIAVAVTDWHQVPVILSYTIFFLVVASFVKLLLNTAFFKDYLESLMPSSARLASNIVMPCGTKISQVKFANQEDIEIIERIRAAFTRAAESAAAESAAKATAKAAAKSAAAEPAAEKTEEAKEAKAGEKAGDKAGDKAGNNAEDKCEEQPKGQTECKGDCKEV